MLYCYLRHVQDLLVDGKHLVKGDLENHLFEGPVIPFGSMVEYHPISAKRSVEVPSIC